MDFGDGESAFGVAPVHTYLNSGTYKVKLTVIDDNYVEATTEMQVTVNETRADLRVTDISLSNDNPKEGKELKSRQRSLTEVMLRLIILSLWDSMSITCLKTM